MKMLIDAIRAGQGSAELLRLVGPSYQEKQEEKRRDASLDLLWRQHGELRLWPVGARQQMARILEEKLQFRERYFQEESPS